RDAFPASRGFRGWSGSSRTHFSLAETWATPGYIPGPLPGGQWTLLLGLYRILPQGCDIEITLQGFEVAGAPSDDGQYNDLKKLPAPATPPSGGPGWLKGDLHSHTMHSDAHATIDELVTMAKQQGLDFLAITDHNTVSHHPWLRSDEKLIVIPGEEVTTYRGHANVIGASGWVDFRFHDEAGLEKSVAQGKALGGLWIVNHPKPTGCDWTYNDASLAQFDAMEVWNGAWPGLNWVSLHRWQQALCRGLHLTATGGSDRHELRPPDTDPWYRQVGSPTTWVYAQSRRPADILDAIRHGRCSISESPKGPFVALEQAGRPVEGGIASGVLTLHVETRVACRARLVTDKGLLQDETLRPGVHRIEFAMPKARFVRAEVYQHPTDDPAYVAELHAAHAEVALGHDRTLALTNPVYSR
ncbi:MAG: CehA/McbA family metallohydrolase, partial [Candidatus Xenobia bacterium]